MRYALRISHLWLLLLEIADQLLSEDPPLHSIKEHSPDVIITGVGLRVLTDPVELELAHQVEIVERDAKDTAGHVGEGGELA
jgi:hypothetical protein